MALVAGALATAPLARVSHATQPEIVLVDPRDPIGRTWTQKAFGRETDYAQVIENGTAYIRAVGRNSASGLFRELSYSTAAHPWLEWTWRVDELQAGADISTTDRDDFAAAIFLIFGKPGPTREPPPALAYVWTSSRTPQGAVVVSPRHGRNVRFMVVRSGAGLLRQPLSERRNLPDDYRLAFGEDPPERVEAISLWTDNDQTEEPVIAYYGAVRARAD